MRTNTSFNAIGPTEYYPLLGAPYQLYRRQQLTPVINPFIKVDQMQGYGSESFCCLNLRGAPFVIFFYSFPVPRNCSVVTPNPLGRTSFLQSTTADYT